MIENMPEEKRSDDERGDGHAIFAVVFLAAISRLYSTAGVEVGPA
jgi:hypothetical protein